MRILLISIFIFLLISQGSSVKATDTTFKVSYISAEHIYIEGGSEDGLNVGDTLRFIDNREDTTLIVLVYTAGHSSSGKIIAGSSLPAVGTRLILHAKAGDIVTEDSTAVGPPEKTEPPPVELKDKTDTHTITRPSTKLNGNLTFGFYHWSDRSPANLDFSQTNTRLRMKVYHLWDKNITLAFRSRGRYDARARAYSSVKRTAWENRLWELSMTYENEADRWYVAAGRILPKRLAASGYLDGANVEYKLANNFSLGILGGSQPDWLYGDPGPSLNRAGGYLSYFSDNNGRTTFEQSIAGIVEAHNDRISRSYIISSGKYVHHSGLSVYHTIEIDINTGWRRDKADESISLSRAFIYAHYRIYKSLRLGLSYDNLKRYWTYEYMTTADSLFDDRTRQGWRTRLDWSSAGKWYASGSFGWRDNPNEPDPTLTYYLNLRRSRLLNGKLSTSVMYSAFNGPRENGRNYSGQVQIYTNKPGIMHFSYGRYEYDVEDIDDSRSSWYLETGLDTDFGRNYFFGGSVQYNTGDDIDGWRFRVELGYRL